MRKDLFEKFDPLIKAHGALPEEVDDPFGVSMDKVLSQTEAVIDGRKTILCGTNNYMGMTFDPGAIEEAKKAIDQFGIGTTGSRVLNGTYAGHVALEKTLKDFYGTRHAIVFSTGYLANLGLLCTLPGSRDYIVIDSDSHASIYDGCSLGRANVVRFRHNDPDDLAKRLGRLPKDAGVLVAVEGIYSMLGDIAPLKEIIAAKNEHGATLLVDEAHSMGFCGRTGRGVAQQLGVEDGVDFIMGTFSKSVGTVGGFIVSNHPKTEVLRLAARPYMFTASLPPSVVASAAASIRRLKGADDLRSKLWRNAKALHKGLKEAGFTLGTGTAESPITAVCLENTEQVVRFWSGLLRSGVYVNMAVPPATPGGLCLLRCSVCAVHTPAQIDTIVERFKKVAGEIGLELSARRPSGAGGKTGKDHPKRGTAAAMA